MSEPVLGEAAGTWCPGVCAAPGGLRGLRCPPGAGLLLLRTRIAREIVLQLLSPGAGVAPDTGLVSHPSRGAAAPRVNPLPALQSRTLPAGVRGAGSKKGAGLDAK